MLPARRPPVIRPIRRRSSTIHAFTLVELMVVVTIVGILATIGIVALRAHVAGSRTAEALAMIQSIRAAQERWRAENMTYLDVSTAGSFYPANPTGRAKRSFHDDGHSDFPSWSNLNPTVPGPVEFGYLTKAGPPGVAMTGLPTGVSMPGFTWPTPTQHWYVVQAICDADGDGTPAFFMASSLNGEVYRQNEGE
jgi:prepilin-type N-terminal cleavage/methylation domain-containing protein